MHEGQEKTVQWLLTCPTSTSTASVFYRFDLFKQQGKENKALLVNSVTIYLNEFYFDEKKQGCSTVWMEEELCSQKSGRKTDGDYYFGQNDAGPL